MVHHNVCPLCSSEKINLLHRCVDHFISKEVFTVYICNSCSFEFTQDYPAETAIGRYYESVDYISHSDTSKGISNKIYLIVRNFMLGKKRSIIENVTGLKRGKLLDIGSGTGHFASTMKKAGWIVSGIEINQKARDFSISKFGLEVISPEKIDTLDAESYDCITLWHVLEHFHDPFKYAADIFNLLRPGGICLVAFPNCTSYDAEYYRQFWAAYDVPRHLWHFNPVTIGLFSEKSGFNAESMKSLPLDLFYISILSERYRGSKAAFFRGILNALPFAISAFFNKRKSSSIISVLRKPQGQ
jgi:2-polyprenyl-3-methyl-5-hydroxy-6-metoxy-1,4-benzoquinol methylase